MKRTRLVAALLVASLMVLPGCPAQPANTSPLEGTWLLQTSSVTGLGSTYLVFGSGGQMLFLAFTSPDGTATVAVPNPDATANLVGPVLTVSLTIPAGTLTFTGTLDSDAAVASGTVTTNLNLFGIPVPISNAPATLTRQ